MEFLAPWGQGFHGHVLMRDVTTRRMEKPMNKPGFCMLLTAGLAFSGAAQATLEPMDDEALSSVHGQLAIVPGLVNLGPLFNLPITAFNLFGAVSLVSGLNVAALSGATGLNVGGLSGVSVANTLGGSIFSGISLPLGVSGVTGVSLPWSINGLGIFNIF